ncbi:MAG: hypothetical protein ACLVG8_04800 [Bifidobacterium longum]
MSEKKQSAENDNRVNAKHGAPAHGGFWWWLQHLRFERPSMVTLSVVEVITRRRAVR